MTPNNNSEETRKFNEQASEETQRIENADEATRMAGSIENTEDESTRINPAAPVSRKAMSASPWAARLGFGVGGAALGFGAGFAVSANAGTADESVTGLAPAATPEDEMTPEEKADSVPSPRESTVLEDDPYDLPASTVNEVKATDEPLDVQPVETEESYANTAASTHSTAHTATVAGNNDNHIVGENPVGNTATATEQPVEVVVDETPATETPATETAVEVTAEVPADESATGTIPNQSDIILTNENGVRYAHIDDDMSFGEAFVAAREQVGTPGVFEWHGNTYGTFYTEEWNEMSVADRSEFIHNVDFPEDLNRVAPVPEVVPEDPQVEILEVASSLTADGSITNSAHMTIDGVDTYMVDVDGDQIMDVAIVDADSDAVFTEGVDVVIPLEDQNITMTDLVAEMNPGVVPTEEPVIDPAMDPAAEMPAEDDMAMNDFESDTMPDF